MGYQFIQIEERERSATLTLDRPPENLLDIGMMDEVKAGVRAYREGRVPRWSNR